MTSWLRASRRLWGLWRLSRKQGISIEEAVARWKCGDVTSEIKYSDQFETLFDPDGPPITIRTIGGEISQPNGMRHAYTIAVAINADADVTELAKRMVAAELQRVTR